MKHYFQQEKSEQIDAVALAWQIASALVIVALCYIAMPAFAGACNNLAAACSFMRDDAATQTADHAAIVPVSLNAVATHAVTPYGGSNETDAPKFDNAVSAVFPNRIAAVQTVQESNDELPLVPPSMPDRHWYIAEAFNAALDHKTQDTPLQATAQTTVTQPVYTGYCQVPGSETSVKMGVPLSLLRPCRAVRT